MTDITREAVERIAVIVGGESFQVSMLRALRDALDEALEVLRWYADANNYKSTGPNSYPPPVYFDAGDRARTILAKHGGNRDH